MPMQPMVNDHQLYLYHNHKLNLYEDDLLVGQGRWKKIAEFKHSTFFVLSQKLQLTRRSMSSTIIQQHCITNIINTTIFD
jgi:hypothetical protein